MGIAQDQVKHSPLMRFCVPVTIGFLVHLQTLPHLITWA